MDSIVFRLAVQSDLYRIASLHTESWRSSYRGILPDTYLDREIAEEREQLWKARFSKLGIDRRYVLLAEINMKLIGFVCVLLDEEPAWGACLDNLHVCPELKGQGLGRQLFVRGTRWVMGKNRIGLFTFGSLKPTTLQGGFMKHLRAPLSSVKSRN